MEAKNILNITTREDFRKWLIQNHNTESECWMVAKKGKNPPTDCVWYLDAVEEVLCFGWIDTTHKKKDRAVFDKCLKKLIDLSQAEKMFGDWNDYGRLLDY